jgi:hypothetical protein
MDPRFKDWLIKKHEHMYPAQKQSFLQIMKFKPDLAVKIISDNLLEWNTVAAFELGELAINDFAAESQEIFKAFKEHFSKEMAAVTQ